MLFALELVEKPVSGEPSPKFHRKRGFLPPLVVAENATLVPDGRGAAFPGVTASSSTIDQVKLTDPIPPLGSVALMVVEKPPSIVGEPETIPLVVEIVSPGGSPTAV